MNLFTHHFIFINSLACKSIEINEKAYSYTAMEQMETANAIKQVFQYYQLTYERRPELQAFVQTSSRIPIKYAKKFQLLERYLVALQEACSSMLD